MKIWIIWSHNSDTYIKKCIDTTMYSVEEYIDARFGSWENLSVEDIIWRCQHMLDSLCDLDYIILPPICEVLYCEWKLHSDYKIIPLFSEYCKYVLHNSVVWKIACCTTSSSYEILKPFRKKCVGEYQISSKQQWNKYFQSHFPLYPVDTQFWPACFDIKRTWFVNKLIKTQCKQLKDYAIDSIIITSRWYAYFSAILNKSCGSRVKSISNTILKQLLTMLLS